MGGRRSPAIEGAAARLRAREGRLSAWGGAAVRAVDCSTNPTPAVVAVIDDQLIALAQAGLGRKLGLGRARVLGDDDLLLSHDDPAAACQWHDAQAAGFGRVAAPGAHRRRNRERNQSTARLRRVPERSGDGSSREPSPSQKAIRSQSAMSPSASTNPSRSRQATTSAQNVRQIRSGGRLSVVSASIAKASSSAPAVRSPQSNAASLR